MSESCPLCGGSDLRIFLERQKVPVFQNLPVATVEAARAVPRGDLRLACCDHCGFVTNLAFSKELIEYAEGYENDQTFSPAFAQYIDELVQRIVGDGGVKNKRVVEVGCGRGQFLARVCERGQNTGVGFDPAYSGPLEVDAGRMRFVREYYGPRFATERADAVICRHVIEHVPAPMDLLTATRDALTSSPDAMVFFETPAVDWILDNVVIQDFFYEHCSYFTAESLRFAFSQTGFTDIAVDSVFGGQYLWLAARNQIRAPPAVAAAPNLGSLRAAISSFQRKTAARLEQLSESIRALQATGPLAVWGAGAKGVTFLNQLDPDARQVDCVVDINPRKQGRFLPGTGHPIVGPDAMASRRVQNVIVMNPNYANEIRQSLAGDGLAIGVHTSDEERLAAS